MSSFQVYQFVTVDRPLTTEAREALGRLSSRVAISGPRAEFTYAYGNLPGDAVALVEKYFDVHAYAASFGARAVSLRLPRVAWDGAAAAPFLDDDRLGLTRVRDADVLTLASDGELLSDWVEASEVEDCARALVAMRARLLRGDLGPLYLLWLATIDAESTYLNEDEVEYDRRFEPPVPPGLRRRLAEDGVLVDFFMVDRDLYEAAIEASPDIVDASSRPDDLRAWVASRPVDEKDAWLARVAEGGGAFVEAEIARGFAATFAPDGDVSPPRRTVEEISARARAIGEERQQAVAAETERKEAEVLLATQAARARRLDALALRVDEAWAQVATLAAEATASTYVAAVETLLDLQALAARDGALGEFRARLDALMAPLRKTSALRRRIIAAKLA